VSIADLDKKQQAIQCFKRASAFAKEGFRPQTVGMAIRYLVETLRLEPEFPEARLLLARAYEYGAPRGFPGWWLRRKARGEYQRAMRLMPKGSFPEKGEVYLRLANNLIASRKLKAATEPLRKAIAEGNAATKLIGYTRLGEVCYRMGKREEAIRTWTRGKELEPANLPRDFEGPSKWLVKVGGTLSVKSDA